MSADLPGPTPRPLTTLAAMHSARMRASTTGSDRGAPGPARALLLAPVYRGDTGWLLVTSPLLPRRRQLYSLPAEENALDFALRVDLLLRWILPPVPVGSGPRPPGEAAALRVAFASPLAMLVLRPGHPVTGDSDVAWWQAFGHACAIVGRRAATALTVTPAGSAEIPLERRDWRDVG
jgi:hypothetical protein